MNIKKYISNTSGLQAFQLMRFGTLILISILFTKSNLTTAQIGNYEILLFISGLVSSFWINGLIQSFLPLFKNNKSFAASASFKSPELFNAFILISLFNLAALLILLIFRAPIEETFNNSSEIQYYGSLLIYIFFSSPAFLIEYIYLLKNKPNSILVYGIISFLLQFTIISVPAIMGWGMNICIYGLVISAVFRYCWLIVVMLKYAQFSVSFQFMKEHLHFGYPLIVSALVGSSAQYVDGFLVMHKYDAATFAVFQYGAREFPLVLLMANALSTAMIPEFASKDLLKKGLSDLKRKSARLIHLLFPATIVLLLSSKWLYPIVFNENFIKSAGIFNIYLLLISSRLVFPQTILIGLKKPGIIMVASVAELALNIALSILFIHLWGMKGVAFATVIAFAFQKIIWIVHLKSKYDIRMGEYVPVGWLSFYTILVFSAFLIMF